MAKIVIPDPRATSRTREADVPDPEAWVSPYTPEQALAIALLNGHVTGSLGDACRMARNAISMLKPMGFTVEFTGV